MDSGVDGIIDSTMKDINAVLRSMAAPSYNTERQLNSDVPYFKEWRLAKLDVIRGYTSVMAKELVTHQVLTTMMGMSTAADNENMIMSLFGADGSAIETEYKSQIDELAKEAYTTLLAITNIKGN